MPISVPRRRRPHQAEGPAGKIESLKQKLIHSIVQGDDAGAEVTRRELQVEQLKQQALQEAANSATTTGTSTARWTGEDSEEEIVEMTATPEAAAFFSGREDRS